MGTHYIRAKHSKSVCGGTCHCFQSALRIRLTVCGLLLSLLTKPTPATRVHADCSVVSRPDLGSSTIQTRTKVRPGMAQDQQIWSLLLHCRDFGTLRPINVRSPVGSRGRAEPDSGSGRVSVASGLRLDTSRRESPSLVGAGEHWICRHSRGRHSSVYAGRSLVRGAANHVSTAVGFLDAETRELGARNGRIRVWIE